MSPPVPKNPFKGLKLRLKNTRNRQTHRSLVPRTFRGSFYAKYCRQEPILADNSLAQAHLNGDILKLVRRANEPTGANLANQDSVVNLPPGIFNSFSKESFIEKLNLKGKEPSVDQTIDFQPPVTSTPMVATPGSSKDLSKVI